MEVLHVEGHVEAWKCRALCSATPIGLRIAAFLCIDPPTAAAWS